MFRLLVEIPGAIPGGRARRPVAMAGSRLGAYLRVGRKIPLLLDPCQQNGLPAATAVPGTFSAW
jgi:hypothetical protein